MRAKPNGMLCTQEIYASGIPLRRTEYCAGQ